MFGQNTNMSLFGSTPTNTNNLFGTQNSSGASSATAPLFSTPPTNLFGDFNTPASNPSANLFGSSSSQLHASSVLPTSFFSSQPSSTPSTTSLFGSSLTTAAPSGGGLFGNASSANTSFFGNPATNTPGAGSLFGGPATTGTSGIPPRGLFGAECIANPGLTVFGGSGQSSSSGAGAGGGLFGSGGSGGSGSSCAGDFSSLNMFGGGASSSGGGNFFSGGGNAAAASPGGLGSLFGGSSGAGASGPLSPGGAQPSDADLAKMVGTKTFAFRMTEDANNRLRYGSIGAMPEYICKSHEELMVEDMTGQFSSAKAKEKTAELLQKGLSSITTSTTSLFGPASPAQSTPTTSLFGPTQNTNNLFGPSQTPSTSLFGDASTGGGSFFGPSSTTTTTSSAAATSLFGPSSPAANLFGTSTPSATTNLFGPATGSASTTAGTGNLFGPTQSTPSTGGNLFGPSQTPSASSLAANLFGTGGTYLFGPMPGPASDGNSLFGPTAASNGTSLFGPTPGSSGTSLFGPTPASTGGSSLFGPPIGAQTATTNLFGPQTTSGGLFGPTTASGAGALNNLFGPAAQSQTAATSLFGANSAIGQPGSGWPPNSDALSPSLLSGRGGIDTPETIQRKRALLQSIVAAMEKTNPLDDPRGVFEAVLNTDFSQFFVNDEHGRHFIDWDPRLGEPAVSCAGGPIKDSNDNPAANNLFGQSPAANNLFGPSPAANNLFGPSPAANNLFGPSPAANNLFGPSPAANNLFGPSPAANNLFGPSPTENNLFGPSPAANNLFGPVSTQNNNSLFGGTALDTNAASTGGGLFGTAPNPVSTQTVAAQVKSEIVVDPYGLGIAYDKALLSKYDHSEPLGSFMTRINVDPESLLSSKTVLASPRAVSGSGQGRWAGLGASHSIKVSQSEKLVLEMLKNARKSEKSKFIEAEKTNVKSESVSGPNEPLSRLNLSEEEAFLLRKLRSGQFAINLADSDAELLRVGWGDSHLPSAVEIELFNEPNNDKTGKSAKVDEKEQKQADKQIEKTLKSTEIAQKTENEAFKTEKSAEIAQKTENEAFKIEKTAENAVKTGNDAELALITPKLSKKGYWAKPIPFHSNASAPGLSAEVLKAVNRFEVGNEHGSIRWKNPVDVRGLDLNRVVVINPKAVDVYPDAADKPEIGFGLNQAAIVSLNNIGPEAADLTKKGPESTNKKFAAALKKRLRAQDAVLKGWCPSKRVAVFRIKHFSRYSLLPGDENNSAVCREKAGFAGFFRASAASKKLAAAPKNFALEMGKFGRVGFVARTGGANGLSIVCGGKGGAVRVISVGRADGGGRKEKERLDHFTTIFKVLWGDCGSSEKIAKFEKWLKVTCKQNNIAENNKNNTSSDAAAASSFGHKAFVSLVQNEMAACAKYYSLCENRTPAILNFLFDFFKSISTPSLADPQKRADQLKAKLRQKLSDPLHRELTFAETLICSVFFCQNAELTFGGNFGKKFREALAENTDFFQRLALFFWYEKPIVFANNDKNTLKEILTSFFTKSGEFGGLNDFFNDNVLFAILKIFVDKPEKSCDLSQTIERILNFPSAYEKSAWRILKSLVTKHAGAFSVLFLKGDENHFINAMAPAVSSLAQNSNSVEFLAKIGGLLGEIAKISDSAHNLAMKYADFLKQKGVFLAIKRGKNHFRSLSGGVSVKRKRPSFGNFAKKAKIGEREVVSALNRAFCLAELSKLQYRREYKKEFSLLIANKTFTEALLLAEQFLLPKMVRDIARFSSELAILDREKDKILRRELWDTLGKALFDFLSLKTDFSGCLMKWGRKRTKKALFAVLTEIKTRLDQRPEFDKDADKRAFELNHWVSAKIDLIDQINAADKINIKQ